MKLILLPLKLKHWCAICVLITFLFQSCNKGSSSISFNEQVRPILATHCTGCHGGVKQQSGLSLLFREDALTKLESGQRAIVPGNPGESELIKRIKSHDPEQRMPPESAPLTPNEIKLLTQWIKEGAKWEMHWAYIPPGKPIIPTVRVDQETSDLDHFIIDNLNKLGLTPQVEAEKSKLLRRVSLDLIGLPPGPDQSAVFLNDPSDDAYERLVDRLLASEHYGEKWASMWLDLARYADSKGYEKDHHRDIYAYREWVIDAFNQDMPYDQFSIEQLAGDLLPNPSLDQYIATGFHRNTMNNNEGGVQNEEYRTAAVIDRTNTTWEVWQGISFSCTQCHNHPSEPFKQKEYYEYLAYFNNTKDEDTGDDAPTIRIFETLEKEEIQSIKNWVADQGKARDAEAIDHLLRFKEPKVWSYRSEVIRKTALNGDDYLMEGRHDGVAVFRDFPLYNVSKVLVHYQSKYPDSYIEIRIDEEDGPIIGTWHLGQPKGMRLGLFDLQAHKGKHDLYFHFKSNIASVSVNDQVGHILWILPHHSLKIFDYDVRKNITAKFLNLLASEGRSSPVMLENPEGFYRKTHILERGSWMSPAEGVGRKIPAVMSKEDTLSENNRLGLARWMFSDDNPLTARVMVNRLWAQIFGTGLVETLEDFGTQGEPPVNQELLDHLAIRLKEDHHWSIKGILKEIVMSSTYRQSSKTDPERLEKDPFNRYLSRGPRFRLSSEQIRDQSLAVSGLLTKKVGGESVMPHLPEGAWDVVYQQYTQVQWRLSDGEDRHRRGLYTYWKRTAPYPSMVAFDSQSRDVCINRRIRTNTPLQALVTLNDPVYLESANELGKLMEKRGNGNIETGIKYGYERAFQEAIDHETLGLLSGLYYEAEKEIDSVQNATTTEDPYHNIQLEGPMAVVANVIMNLDQFIMKE